MTLTQQLITIAAAVAGTMLTRFLPFLLFPGNRPTPSVIIFLGRVLPPAIMGLLVVYALRNVNLTCDNHGLPEALACGLLIFLQLWRRNILLTIAVSTVFYMFLLQKVFSD